MAGGRSPLGGACSPAFPTSMSRCAPSSRLEAMTRPIRRTVLSGLALWAAMPAVTASAQSDQKGDQKGDQSGVLPVNAGPAQSVTRHRFKVGGVDVPFTVT